MKKIVLILTVVFSFSCALDQTLREEQRQGIYVYSQIEITNIIHLDDKGNVLTSIYLDSSGNVIRDQDKIEEIINNPENKYKIIIEYV